MSNIGTNTMPRPMPATVSGAVKSHAADAGPGRLERGEQPGQADGHEDQARLQDLAAQLVHRHPAAAEPAKAPSANGAMARLASSGVQRSPICMRIPSVIPMPDITLTNTTAKPSPDT